MIKELTEEQKFFKLAGVRRRCANKPVFRSEWVKREVGVLERDLKGKERRDLFSF